MDKSTQKRKYKNTESKTDLVSSPCGEAGMRVLHCNRLDRSNCLKSTPLKPYEPLSIGCCAFRKNEHLHILNGVEQLKSETISNTPFGQLQGELALFTMF